MSHAKPILALTGASGGIGRTLWPVLLRQYRVRGLFRSRGQAWSDAEALGIEPVQGSLDDEGALDRLVEGAEVVLHAAASVVRELADARRVNVDGTLRLAHSAARAGVKRFVHVSTIAVYLGNRGHHGVFTEELELVENWRQDQYSRTKLQAEIELRKFVSASDRMELVIVRPTCVYGPGIEAWTVLPLRLIRRRMPMMIGDGAGQIDVVHADDVAQGMLLAATHPAAAGQTFNLGGQAMSTREFLGYYARMAARPLSAIPRPVVRFVLNAGRMERFMPQALVANASPNRLRLLEFCTSGVPGKPKFPSTKMHAMLGYTPKVPLSAGMLRTQRWALANRLGRRRNMRHEEGNYAFTPALTALPECEADIQQVVHDAVAQGMGVRAVGAVHSMAPLPSTSAVAISLQRMRGVVRVDGPLVTVHPGTHLWELNDALAVHGLALPALGAITKQTIAGVISTGTHGGSIHHGSVADAVEGVRLVTADGNVLELARGDECFNGVVVGMGLCGVVSQVTLRCVPAFGLRSSVQVMPFDELLQRFDELQRNHEYCDINWYPLAEQVEVMTCTRLADLPANRQIRAGHSPGANGLTRWFVHKGLNRFYAGRWRKLHARVVRNWVGTWYPEREGRSDFVLAYQDYHPSKMPVADMDMAVPVERATEALRTLRAHFARTGCYPVLGMRVRTQRAEPFWLSGSCERDACWIEIFHAHPGTMYVRQMHDVLAPFGYRPHWGKSVVPALPGYWPRVYPRWGQFQALRRQLDPQGVFASQYARAVGLVDGST